MEEGIMAGVASWEEEDEGEEETEF